MEIVPGIRRIVTRKPNSHERIGDVGDVIRERGTHAMNDQLEQVGNAACRECHSRYQPDSATLTVHQYGTGEEDDHCAQAVGKRFGERQ